MVQIPDQETKDLVNLPYTFVHTIFTADATFPYLE